MSGTTLRIEIAAAPELLAALEALARSLTASPSSPTGAPALAAPPGGLGALDVSSQQTAPAALTPPPAASSPWTAERRAVIARDFPDLVPILEIVDRVNALPGKPVTRKQVYGYGYSYLKLRRPAAEPPPQRRPGVKWTVERRELYCTLYAQDVPNAEILARVNALPGPPCATVEGASGWLGAHRTSLTRGGDHRSRAQKLGPANTPNAALDVAARELADDVARQGIAPVDWRAAMDWAERAKVPMDCDDDALLDRVNSARRIYGLPEFRIVARRGPAHSANGTERV